MTSKPIPIIVVECCCSFLNIITIIDEYDVILMTEWMAGKSVTRNVFIYLFKYKCNKNKIYKIIKFKKKTNALLKSKFK